MAEVKQSEVFDRGVKVGEQYTYTDPDTGKSYSIVQYYGGRPPTEEEFKQQIQSGELQSGTDVQIPENIKQSVTVGRARAKQEELKQKQKAAGVVFSKEGKLIVNLPPGVRQSQITNIQERKGVTPLEQAQQVAQIVRKGGYNPSIIQEPGNAISVVFYSGGKKYTVFTSKKRAFEVVESGPKTNATIKPEYLYKFPGKEFTLSEKKPEAPPKEKPFRTPGGMISEYKPTTGAKVQKYIRENEGTFRGILTGAGYSVFSYGKGFVKGFIAPFRPSTYTEIARLFYEPQKVRQEFYQLGPAIEENPALLFEIGGQFKGFETSSGLVMKGAAKVLSKTKKEVLVTVQPQKGKITAKELKALTKLQQKRTPGEIKALENYLGRGMSGKEITIDISKLSKTKLEYINKLKAKGKISTDFEIVTEGAQPSNVGTSFKQKFKVPDKLLKARKAAGEKLASAIQRKGFKQRVARETKLFEATKKLDALEKRIRAEMARTGKTAAEIVKEKKLTAKYNKAAAKVNKESAALTKAIKESGGKESVGTSPAAFAANVEKVGSLKDIPGALGPGGTQSPLAALSGTKLKYKVITETQVIRGLKPVQVITYPSITQLKVAGTLSKVSQQKAAFAVIPKFGSVNIPLQSPTTRTTTIQNIYQIQNPRVIQGQSSYLSQKSIQSLNTGQITQSKTEQVQQTKVVPISIQTPKTETAVKPNILSTQIGRQKVEPITKPDLIFFGSPKEEKKVKDQEPGYNVFVKRTQAKITKGKYVSKGYQKVNKQPLTKNGALVKGGEIVDEYANRSFKIKRAGVPAKSGYNDSRWGILKDKFRQSRKNSGVFVEKSGFAIDSANERNNIPFEAKRQRKIKKTIWGF